MTYELYISAAAVSERQIVRLGGFNSISQFHTQDYGSASAVFAQYRISRRVASPAPVATGHLTVTGTDSLVIRLVISHCQLSLTSQSKCQSIKSAHTLHTVTVLTNKLPNMKMHLCLQTNHFHLFPTKYSNHKGWPKRRFF